MRKVLLATTALVAMGGVSAASADITLSGSAAYNYITHTGTGGAGTLAAGGPKNVEDRDMNTQVDVGIAMSSSLDNGMSISGGIDLDEGGYDDSGWKLGGDFGTLAFGGYANDGFGSTATGLTADEAITLSTTNGVSTATVGLPYKTVHNDFIPHSDVSLTLPAVSGFQLGVGITDGAASSGDGTQWGLKYSMDAGSMTVDVAYASHSTGTSGGDASSAGATLTMGDTKIVVASNETGTYTADSVGFSYAVSEALSVQGYTGSTDKSDTSGYEVEDTALGLTYTVTTGLKVSVTHNDFSGKGGTNGAESGTRTAIALDATF